MIPYGRQNINQADIDAVVDVLKSDFLTQGPAVPAFEKTVAEYCGTQHAIAVNSATSALHIACLALDVTSGDIVWTKTSSQAGHIRGFVRRLCSLKPSPKRAPTASAPCL